MSFSFIHLVKRFDLPATSFLRERRIVPSAHVTTLRKVIVKRKGNTLKIIPNIHFCLLLIFISFSSIQACSGHFVNPAIDTCWSYIFPMNIHLLPQGNKIKEGENP
jgi:hypothetical protein